MAYFPFFADISHRDGLVVGGGAVALRKIRALLPFGPRLTAAAPAFLPAVETLPGVTLVRSPFSPALLEGRDFVVAATDDRALNRDIASLCRQRRLPVNAVDDREACTFLFPALVRRGALSIGISTGGASPSAAIYLKEQIAALLPEALPDVLVWLDAQRPAVKAALAEEADRAACFSSLFARCLQAGGPLDGDALAEELARFSEKAR